MLKVWEVKYRALNDFGEIVWFSLVIHAISERDAIEQVKDAGGMDVEVVCELDWHMELDFRIVTGKPDYLSKVV